MDNRFVAAVATLIIVVAGCSEEQKPERARVAKITVDGNTQTAHEISCTQVEFALTIETTSGTTQTDTFLEMGGEKPIARTRQYCRNFEGFSGHVAGEACRRARPTFRTREDGAHVGHRPGNRRRPYATGRAGQDVKSASPCTKLIRTQRHVVSSPRTTLPAGLRGIFATILMSRGCSNRDTLSFRYSRTDSSWISASGCGTTKAASRSP